MIKSKAIMAIRIEHNSAVSKFPPFLSPHEGYAVLLEEMDELWDEIKKQYGDRTREQMRKEATQIAAMALRFMIDLT